MPDAIGERRIEVWSVDLDAPAAPFAALLSDEERAHAARFRFEHLRRDYTVGRGVLRLLLGRYLALEPAAVRLRTGANGKPATDGISFNLSHCGATALLAFTSGCELGVDVEAIRPLPDLLDLARRFFCAEETDELLAVPAASRARAFFSIWTRKEAYVKATGHGLHTPLDRFRVSLDAPARFVYLDGDSPRYWMLHDLAAVPAHAAALAYRDAPRPVELLPHVNAAELAETYAPSFSAHGVR